MASAYQQQVRLRKFLYIGLIVVLFTASIVWRKLVIDGLADRLAIREESRGEVELLGSFVRLSMTGSRGLVTCILWDNAIDKQKKNQWNQLEVLVDALTRLQPHFTTPWLFQSWNLAYNVSVESDRPRDKYYYMSRGIELLARGERQNHDHPDFRWSIGFYIQHKIGQSDETNYIRSLFQLSMIPPGERDPARFWKQTPDGPAFDYLEFEKFCNEHPHLVRRLHEGVQKNSLHEKRRLFTCPTPQDVVQFLDDNISVPSMYIVKPFAADSPAQARGWSPTKDTLLEPESRFPALPPPHPRPFDPEALTSGSTLRDDVNGFAVSQAWYAYAQEPLPLPGPLPGSSLDITDPAHQRRPKRLTTLIFRHYPAMGRRYMADDGLEAEGWYDGEGWDGTDLFRKSKEPSQSGKQFLFGAGVKWAGEAWARAKAAWQKHGEENHLIFPSPAAEQNERDLAKRFAEKYRINLYGPPPQLAESQLDATELREYQAAKFMYEYEFYRTLTNFKHHYTRAIIEALPQTIQCRKLFFKAEQARLNADVSAALLIYSTPVDIDFGGEKRKLDPLAAWRDILLQNKDFRRDSFSQEASAEIQLRYMLLWNKYPGQAIKEKLVKASPLLPLVPVFNRDVFRLPIVQGPFDVDDAEGVPLIEATQTRLVLERMGLRKPAPPAGPPAGGPGNVPAPPGPK